MSNIVDLCHAKLRKRRRNVDKINDAVTPVAEKMIEDLLRMDAAFFKEYHYADTIGASAEDERINIDDLIWALSSFFCCRVLSETKERSCILREPCIVSKFVFFFFSSPRVFRWVYVCLLFARCLNQGE